MRKNDAQAPRGRNRRESRRHVPPYEKGHGRIERRRCAAPGITGLHWIGHGNPLGRKPAIRIERENLNSGKRGAETIHGLASPGALLKPSRL